MIEELNEKYQKAVKTFNGIIDEIREETDYKWVQQVLSKIEEEDAREF
jgi:hypothetical protein